ncbi:MAG: TonB-dependent hemoglobin/transferrin/lactoferrin family receptor, partial [Stutzerimonas stutzeri]
MKFSPHLLALAIASALTLPVHAETAADPNGAQTLDTIEVKAQRERQQSANQNVTSLSSKDLQQQGAQSMEDAIRYVPGVEMVDLGRAGFNGFNIR